MRGFPAPICVESGSACPVSAWVKLVHVLLVSPEAALPARIAALALCAFAPLAATAAEKPYELTGKPAPDLVARSLTGQNVRVSEHRGEVVVVSFWSGSCNTCRAILRNQSFLCESNRAKSSLLARFKSPAHGVARR